MINNKFPWESCLLVMSSNGFPISRNENLDEMVVKPNPL